MGTLIAMRYRATMFAKLADHTYVKCGTGARAWSCWGGKTGGTELRRGVGSTKRADAIAEQNARAGITCYLINGVCHQAANRVLLPARITVRGAIGYDVSEALFGTYGRPRGAFGLCKAPFDQHEDIAGDLDECVDAAPSPKTRKTPQARASAAARLDARRENTYLEGVWAVYRKVGTSAKGPRTALADRDLEGFHDELFRWKIEYSLGAKTAKSTVRTLADIRRSAERSRLTIEEWFLNGDMTVREFVEAFNSETVVFQHAAAGALNPADYRSLFGLRRGDAVVLADPKIVERAFAGFGPGRKGVPR